MVTNGFDFIDHGVIFSVQHGFISEILVHQQVAILSDLVNYFSFHCDSTFFQNLKKAQN